MSTHTHAHARMYCIHEICPHMFSDCPPNSCSSAWKYLCHYCPVPVEQGMCVSAHTTYTLYSHIHCVPVYTVYPGTLCTRVQYTCFFSLFPCMCWIKMWQNALFLYHARFTQPTMTYNWCHICCARHCHDQLQLHLDTYHCHHTHRSAYTEQGPATYL